MSERKHDSVKPGAIILGYGLSKFAGNTRGKNDLAELMGITRNGIFQKALDSGLGHSLNTISNIQDGFDPLFENCKKGHTKKDSVERFRKRKIIIDEYLGNLSIDEYANLLTEYLVTKPKQKGKYWKIVQETEEALSVSLAGGKTKVKIEEDSETISPEQNQSPEKTDAIESENSEKKEVRKHLLLQKALKDIAKKGDFEVSIARNDRTQVVGEEQLGDSCLDFPTYSGLTKDTTSILSLIDVVWIDKEGAIAAAFEVECTTDITKGIYRMGNLLCSLPSINTSLYIVVPQKRVTEACRKINVPLYRKTLKNKVKILTTEDLDMLMNQVKDFEKGIINPLNLVNTKAKKPSDLYSSNDFDL